MGRPGVTEYEVRKAIHRLAKDGTEASVRKVQDITGGSSTTIGLHLRNIRGETGEIFGEGGAVDRELKEVVGALHDKLQAITDQQIAAAKFEAQERIDAAIAEALEAKRLNSQTAELLKTVRSDLEQAEAKIVALTTRLNSELLKIVGMEQQVRALTERRAEQAIEILRLHKESENRQAAFEAFQAASARNTNELREAHESTFRHERAQNNKLYNERLDLAFKNVDLTRDNERLEQQLATSTRDLVLARAALSEATEKL